MSQTIWTQCGGRSNICQISTVAFRANASNFNQALLKHAGSLEEYEVLERMVDEVKTRPGQNETLEAAKSLHYIFRYAFRYPPLKHGSRFGTALEPGIWYGATKVETALAEASYYSLRFLITSEGLHNTHIQSMFALVETSVSSENAIDLQKEPFSGFPDLLSKTSYSTTQTIGRDMRKDGIDLFLFSSARTNGTNLGVFKPSVFSGAQILSSQVYASSTTKLEVKFVKTNHYGKPESYQFSAANFFHDGKFPIVS